LCTLLAELEPLPILSRPKEGEVTISACFAVAMAILGGPVMALVGLTTASLVADALRRKPARRIAFNVAQYALAVAACGLVLDALTRLPNRELLRARLGQALRGARRTGDAVVVMLMDLDHFKEVNDTLGHHHGDRLLEEVARRLRAALRESDTVARLGGDEF